MPKYGRGNRILRPLQLMSGWRLRTLLFTVSRLLLILFSLTALWKVFGYLFFSHDSGYDNEDYVNWGIWKPVVNVFSLPTWGFRQLWPMYLAKRILPRHGSNVFVFSSVSPFHDAVHLADPRFIYEREQSQQLLNAVVQGLVARIIWIYPLWRHSSSLEFHGRTVYHVGLATIELTGVDSPLHDELKDHDFVYKSSHSSITSDSTSITTLCMCRENDTSCTVPFFNPFSLTVSPESCTRNATVLYEYMVDLLAETLLSSHFSKPSTSIGQTSRLHQLLYGSRSKTKEPVKWLQDLDQSDTHLSHVVLLDTNYFGTSLPSTDSSSQLPSVYPPASVVIPSDAFQTSQIKQIFASHLQRMHNHIAISLKKSSATKGMSFILHFTQLFTDSMLLLLPTQLSEPTLGQFHVNRFCGRRSPDSVALLSLEDHVQSTRWHAILSSLFPHPTGNICAQTNRLVSQLLSTVENSIDLSGVVSHMWHWLCKLGREQLISLAQWIPCYDSLKPEDVSLKRRGTIRTIRLCPRPAPIDYPDHPLNSKESKLLLDRLQVILRALSAPRYIAVVSRPASTMNSSFDPLDKVCAYFEQLY